MTKTKHLFLIMTLLLLSFSSNSFASQKINGVEISKVAKKYLENKLKDIDGDAKIVNARPIPNITAPNGKVSFYIKERDFSQIGRFYTIPVSILINNTPKRTVYVNFKIQVFKDVVIAKSSLKKHQTITNDHIKVENREISKIRNKDSITSSPQEVIGLRAAKMIPAGKIINDSMIQQVPLVEKKNQVKVIGKIGNIEATLYGIALEEGYKNEIIKVQNINTQKTFLAKVIEKNHVEVVF